MNASERAVRTRAGWVGVEISRSRARRRDRADYGLYRVRTAAERHWHVPHEVTVPAGEWTAYAFTLPMIDACVDDAIREGTPVGPGALRLRAYGTGWSDPPTAVVPTRWTHRYQGRRDLGATGQGVGNVGPPSSVGALCEHPIGVMCPAGLSMGEHVHEAEGFDCAGRPHLGPCVPVEPVAARSVTVRQRRRDANREFQAQHAVRRAHGLERRHQAKLSRRGSNQQSIPPAESNADGLKGSGR